MENVFASVDRLDQTYMFKGLTENQHSSAIHNGIKKQLPPNEFLFHQGSPASRCYLVIKGQLKLTKLNEHGKEVIIRYVGPGELTAAVVALGNGVCRRPYALNRNRRGGLPVAGNGPLVALATAVATAIAVMHLTKTLHPPGGAISLITVIGGDSVHRLGDLYVLILAGTGAVVLLIGPC